MAERTGDVPQVTLLAGPNGAGKSTLLKNLEPGDTELVLADPIADEYRRAGLTPDAADIRAAKDVIIKLRKLEAHPRTFLHETNLAGGGMSRRLANLENAGYWTRIIFVGLLNEDLAVARVAERVRTGGHHVREPTIRGRWAKGICEFFGYYRFNVEVWNLYDNTDAVTLVAEGGRTREFIVHQRSIWDEYVAIWRNLEGLA